MKKTNTSIVIASLLAFVAFVSVSYTSCIKAKNASNFCDYTVCQNGGSCVSGKCNCPAGYDDSLCNVVWTVKYPGYWNVKEKIVGSNYPSRKNNKDSVYLINITAGATPTSLIVDSMLNNKYYHDIILALNSATSWTFNPYFTPYDIDPFNIRGGYGFLTNDSTMTGKYYREMQTPNLGLVRDTLIFTMTKPTKDK